MVAPIQLRSQQIIRDARKALRLHRDNQLLRRRAKLLGVKALLAAQKAFDLQEQAFARLSYVNQKDWHERRRVAETFLREIAKGLT
jgi:hypothetical protein